MLRFGIKKAPETLADTFSPRIERHCSPSCMAVHAGSFAGGCALGPGNPPGPR